MQLETVTEGLICPEEPVAMSDGTADLIRHEWWIWWPLQLLRSAKGDTECLMSHACRT